MFRCELSHQLWHKGGVNNRHDAQAQSALQLFRVVTYVLEEILKLTQERASVLLEHQTCRGQQDAFSMTLKEGHPKTCLDIAHLLRDTRLRNSQMISSAAKTTSLGNRQKISQVPNINRIVNHRDISPLRAAGSPVFAEPNTKALL